MKTRKPELNARAIRSAYSGRPSALSRYVPQTRTGFSDATTGGALSVINRFAHAG